jgi:hypothetical protein
VLSSLCAPLDDASGGINVLRFKPRSAAPLLTNSTKFGAKVRTGFFDRDGGNGQSPARQAA